ncbi:MAG: zinc-dependent metalloprotease, partial [Planctomycetaceae bacterium]|nr:zinc-dependent metalloprotease [Planctomycetaceae bacterium]
DFADLEGHTGMFSRDHIGKFSRELSYWGSIKGFPNNIEFRVIATYSGIQLGSHSSGITPSDKDGTSVTIHYSISKLPASGYVPRIADDRIGYFITVHKDYSKNPNDNHIVRYINRWNLQKADPNAELSPPKKPIIFWISKTTPFRYRKAVREGILEWNKAFERIGFVNAIEVRQQADNDTWDAEDINYNTFRWISSDAGLAMGPSRVNPMTGEILDADIIFDATFVRSWRFTFDKIITDLVPPSPKKMSDNELINFILQKNSRHNTDKIFNKNIFSYEDDNDLEHSEINDAHECSIKNGICSYASVRATQLAIASLLFELSDDEKNVTDNDDQIKPNNNKRVNIETDDVIAAKNIESENDNNNEEEEDKNTDKPDVKKDKSKKSELQKKLDSAFDRFVLESLKDIVMHEIGHTLGLRHNFKASSWLTLDEINDPKRSKEYGIAGSVMDYLPINIAPKGKPQGDYFMTTLGPYDYLAIEYGYKKLSGGTDGEVKKLQAIASRQAEKGNHYAPDEDVITYADPLAIKRDLGSQPIDYAIYVTELYNQLLPKILDRAVRDGESYKNVSKLYLALLTQRTNALRILARNIGGQYHNRDHRGDPGERSPIQIVDAKTQRESVDFLCKTVLSRGSFSIPADLYNKFNDEIWLTGAHTPPPPLKIKIGELFLQERLKILKRLTDHNTLTRINDLQFRVTNTVDAYTVEELFDSLTKTIFEELDTIGNGDFSNNKPAIEIQQRDLQNNYFQLLSTYAIDELQNSVTIPVMVQPITEHQLTVLLKKIETVLKSDAKLDTGSRLHLEHLKSRIEKVFNATLSISKP